MQVKWLLWLAALSFIPTLGFYMVGEEGIYTISTLEMWHSGDWLRQTMFGHNLQRPPLLNWLAIALLQLLGAKQVLLAIRLLSVAATLGMVGWLYWLVRRVWREEDFARFAALSCLALADLLLYRGWLSYTDPLFGFFIFGALALLWVGTLEQRRSLLLASVLLIGCALLTKVFTAYLFYASVLFVLLWRGEQRRFLLSPLSLLVLSTLVVVPVVWFSLTPQVRGQSGSMLYEILGKLQSGGVLAYGLHLGQYVLDVLLWLAPAPLLALYLWLRKRQTKPESHPLLMQQAGWMLLLCVLPYWLAPQGGIRYLLPVYPLIALLSARLIWRAGDSGQRLVLRWFAGLILFKWLFALALFPYYQSHYRGENYVQAGRELHQRTLGFPVYAENNSSIGENVIGQMDIERWPDAPLRNPPAQWDNGYLLSWRDSEPGSTLVEKLTLAKDDLYLYCRGAACAHDPQRK